MGYEKEREIEQDEQGWRYSHKTICFRCVSDPYLREEVKSRANKSECDFCNRRSRQTPNAIPFNDFMRVVAGAIFQYYSHVEEDTMAWDSEDQTYVGSTYSTWELVRYNLAPATNEDALREIIDSLGEHTWCDKSPYSLSDSERYQYSWEEFCKTVKHETHYFFNSPKEVEVHSDKIPVPQMLDALQDLINETGLVRSLPSETALFRVRAHCRAEACDTWQSLGSPPPDAAVSSRMSAAGISMFYAALDMATAKAEMTISLLPKDGKILTGAKWVNTQPFTVLDLTNLPQPPSFYARVRYDREQMLFLRHFVETITQPIAHDGKHHIEYVPTQILTEYFRYKYRTHDNFRLDGIMYPSAQRKGGRSIVIFASQSDLDPNPSGWQPATPLLVLDSASIKRLRRTQSH
ncbi:MAG TPA: HEPN-associated N-terminal domain-containing protein [Terriglobia bacterium]|nr:HEPN-associated N-terminal domain-containing protein [Terriglobia bacterium]